jgi:hypothetical protein
MARRPATPESARNACNAHAAKAEHAAQAIAYLLADPLYKSPEERAADFATYAKIMEAAGCYIRRASDRGLI